MKLKLHGYAIHQSDSTQVIVGMSEDEARDDLYQYVSLWWDDVSTASELAHPPADRMKAIETYFDLHEEEYADEFTVDLDLPPDPTLLDALNGLFEHCAMVHKHWGDGNNQKEANAAIEAARAAIAAATGEVS